MKKIQLIKNIVLSDIAKQDFVTAETGAQRSQLHVVAVEEFQILIIPLRNGQRISLEIHINHLVEQLDGENAVINIPAHPVVKIFRVLFSFEETYRVVHQPAAKAQREESDAEIGKSRLHTAAVFRFAVVPLVKNEGTGENRHRHVELLTKPGVSRFVVAENIERDAVVHAFVFLGKNCSKRRIVDSQLGKFVKAVPVRFVGLKGHVRGKLGNGDLAEFFIVLTQHHDIRVVVPGDKTLVTDRA